MDSDSKIPFDQLSKKWVKILRIAFKAIEQHGQNPDDFIVTAGYRLDETDSFFVYELLFYPKEVHWMDVGGDVNDYIVVIKADNLQFIKIYQGRN